MDSIGSIMGLIGMDSSLGNLLVSAVCSLLGVVIIKGNLLTLMQGKVAHHFVDKLMKQVKVGIATIHFVPLVRFNIVAVADPDIINTLAPISEEKNAFIYEVYNDLSNCRAGMFTAKTSSVSWMYHRKATRNFFSHRNMMQKLPVMIKLTKEWADSVDNVADKMKSKNSVNIEHEMEWLALRILFHAGFGYDLTVEDCNQFCHNITIVLGQVMGENIWWPLKKYCFFLPIIQAYKEAYKGMLDILQVVIDYHREKIASGEGEENSLMWHILNARNPETGELDDDEQIKAEMLTFIVAGMDTSSHTIAWTVWLLTQSPDKLKLVLQEVDAVMSGSEPTAAELNKLSYLDACINESMRLKPVAAFGVQKVLSEDVEVKGGYRLKKGQYISYPLQAVHLNPNSYEEAESFVPERWYNDKLLEGKLRSEKRFIPFSFGKRDCIGQTMALLEMKVILSMLYKRFNFELTSEVVEMMDITMHSGTGIHVAISSRKFSSNFGLKNSSINEPNEPENESNNEQY